ncbi:hypothetical protein BGX29_010309 [Mortierella sp. GBA35]|nr:hypothetical protein BGX29_010309 [Mortierella sp. GBA35]
MGPSKDITPTFTLVCGHLASRISLTPEPRQSVEDDIKSRLQHLDLGNGNHTSDNRQPTHMQTDSETDMQDSTKSKPDNNKTGLRSLQRQTLANQGCILATDLSIIGFMKESHIQSPPVISRHWITLERPQEQDAVAIGGPVNEVVAPPPQPPPPPPPPAPIGPVDPRTFKTEDGLAASLFPEASHRSNPHPPGLPMGNAFQQRQQHLQQQHQQFQPNFNGHTPGITHPPNMPNLPNMPPTSHNSNLIQGSSATPQQINHAGKFPNAKPDLTSRPKESAPQLYTTLYESLNKQSMVAFVALQYPDKQCVKSRKSRREKEHAVKKVVAAGMTGPSNSPIPSLLSSDPSSSPALGVTASTTTTTVSIKDDASSARATASHSTVAETDRQWYGILVVASHYLANPLHTVPVYSKSAQVRDKTGVSENLVTSAMGSFGVVRVHLRDIQSIMAFLVEATEATPLADIEKRVQQIHNHQKALKTVSGVYGYRGGVDAAKRLFTATLRELEAKPTASDAALREIRKLLKIPHTKHVIQAVAGPAKAEKSELALKAEREFAELAKESRARRASRTTLMESVTRPTVVAQSVPKPSQAPIDHDDEEGPDEDLGGGSVMVRNVAKGGRAPLGHTHLGSQGGSTPGGQITKQTFSKPSLGQDQGSSMNLTEQDTAMEQSASARSSHPKPVTKLEELELAIHTDIVLPEGQNEPPLLSPGAPHKRRRELRDEGSEDGSSVEAESARISSQGAPAVPVTTPSQIEELSQGATKKPVRKTKRVKAEPFDDTGTSKSPLVLSDEGEGGVSSIGRLQPETASTSSRPVSPAHPPHETIPPPPVPRVKQSRQKQTKAAEQQLQQQQEQKEQQQRPSQPEPPRSLPPPTFVSQHQRTPSGTPQWLAANSTPSLLSGIKGPGRPKKPAAAAAAQQPAPAPQAPPQQSQPQQHPHQQQETAAQRQQPMLSQQQAPAVIKEERHPGYAADPHSRPQGTHGYYAGQAPSDHEMQHRRSMEGVVEVPDPRYSGYDSVPMRTQHPSGGHDPSGYHSRTHTPPIHERNVTGPFPAGQAQNPRYDPRLDPSQQPHGPGSSVHQRQASTGNMPGAADQVMEYRRVEDPRQRQHLEVQEHQRYAQKPPSEHPESMRQAPQETSSRQRQQEWGYAVDPSIQYASSAVNPSRAPGQYAGQGIPQEHPGHGHPSHYTSGPPPQSAHLQQQYYQGQEREHMQHAEPMAPASSTKTKAQATSKTRVQAVSQHQEEDERAQRYQASYEQQQQQHYQQPQPQQQQLEHRQEQSRHYPQLTPQHMAPQQQGMPVQYPSSGPKPPPPGRRSGQHSRNNSGSGHPSLMMVNPVSGPLPSAMDQAAREHSMRRNSPGPSGYDYHHPVQTHSRSRGSSPSLTGYNNPSHPSHGPAPIQGPVVAGGPRQGSHSRNSSGYEVAPARGQVQDPYLAAAGRSSGAAGHYPPQQATAQHHGQPHPEHPSSLQQQAYGRHSQQDLRVVYSHSSPRSQDMSGLAAQQGHSRAHEDVFQQHGQHTSQQQHAQQQYQVAHRSAEGQRMSSSSSSSSASRTERQWYQEQEQQHYSQAHPSHQQQHGYASHGGQPYHPSQVAHHGYPAGGPQQGMYQSSSDSRYPPQGGPPPPGHPDPHQGPPGPGSQGSGGSSSGGTKSRISLSSLLN